MSSHRDVVQDPAVSAALAELDDVDATTRLFERDATLFGEEPDVQAVVADRLGWLDAAEGAGARADALEAFASDLRGDGVERVVLAGMGGSSLAPEVFARTFASHPDAIRLEVLDSTHPDAVRQAFDRDLAATLVLVSSKSGGTLETRSFADYAASVVASPSQLAAITDGGSELEEQARGWRATWLNPADIGGRYSALSHFGTVPAAVLGFDVREVWRRAEAVLDAAGRGSQGKPDQGAVADTDPAVVLAAFIGGHGRDGRDKLTLLAAPGLESFGDWAEQLVAESLGKSGRGVVPVVGEPIGAPEAYGTDRCFVELRLDGARAPGADALEAAGLPVLSLDLADALDVGAQFMLWEVAVAMAGVLLDVNPFDEPNVAESKQSTGRVLDELAEGTPLPEPEAGDLAGLLGSVQPGDYVSLQAYVPPSPVVHATLSELQGVIRDVLGVAVTAGVGPRFLHSTGQLHKGGPPTCVALQVVDAHLWAQSTRPVPIPGRRFDFSQLIRAQAVGDLRSLRAHDRRCAQVPVGGVGGLPGLVDRVRAALPR